MVRLQVFNTHEVIEYTDTIHVLPALAVDFDWVPDPDHTDMQAPFIARLSAHGVSVSSYQWVAEGGVGRQYIWQWYQDVNGKFELLSGRNAIAGGLRAGEYRVKVRDSENNEAISGSLVFEDPDDLEVRMSHQDPACHGDHNGWLAAGVTGGTIPYRYFWTDREESDSNRCGGAGRGPYRVRVTDRRGCAVTGRDTLSEPTRLLVEHEVFFPSVYGGSDGIINLNLSGGTPPYSCVREDDGTIGTRLQGLAARDEPYRVTVTDAHGCLAVDTPRMYNPMVISVEVRDSVSCYGRKDGKLAAVIRGGVGAPHVFEWYIRGESGFRALASRDSLLTEAGEGVYRVR